MSCMILGGFVAPRDRHPFERNENCIPFQSIFVQSLLDQIKKVAAGREVIIGGDFNLTVSLWPGPGAINLQTDCG